MSSPESPKTPLSKQKGFKRIVIGLILVILQIVAASGSTNAGMLTGKPIAYLMGFFSIGIIGIVLIVFGVAANKKHQ